MKKFFMVTLAVCGITATSVYSQVGMPTNNPNKNAALDLNRTDGTSVKGLLLPNVALTGVNSFAPMTAHVAGMHVWNTATAGTGINAVIPGEYFNDGSKWHRVASGADAWMQGGNNNGALKLIGTNDAFDLPIETNGIEKMRVTSGGQVLINTTTPLTGGTTAKVLINNGAIPGALQIKDGSEGTGKVLTSNINGLATWQTPSNVGSIVGQWSLVCPVTTFNSIGVFVLEKGTSSIIAGDEVGLVAVTNGVKVPQGKYLVFVDHDIWGYEFGSYKVQTTTGTAVFQKYYNSWLSGASFVLDASAGSVTLQSYFNPDVSPNPTFYNTPPFSKEIFVTLTFLKIS